MLVSFIGDVVADETLAAADNTASPGAIVQVALASGDNAIVPPSGMTAVTVMKPAGNVIDINLKGDPADAGIHLHFTDPDTISLRDGGTFYLNASGPVTVHLIWS